MAQQPRKTASDRAKAAADKVREGAEKARETIKERVVDPAKRAGEAMKASGEKAMENNKAIGLKMLDQAETNTREAFAAMRAAAGAKDLSEVMKIQGDFLREQGRPDAVVDLIKRLVTVSMRTQELLAMLPALEIREQ